jgi:hypothetical protein
MNIVLRIRAGEMEKASLESPMKTGLSEIMVWWHVSRYGPLGDPVYIWCLHPT